MKLSVFTVMVPDLTPEELIEHLARYGYTGVEWRYTTQSAKETDPPSFWGRNLCTLDPSWGEREWGRIREMTHQAGIETVALMGYLTAGDLSSTQRAMEAAQALGAPALRVAVPPFRSGDDYHQLFAQALRYLESVQEISQAFGVRALIETHMGTIVPSASLTHRLVSHFDPQHIGVIWDPGNLVYEGYEHNQIGLQLLGPYLAHVHVKNTQWIKGEDGWRPASAPLAEGVVNWVQTLRDLTGLGYQGFLGFEDFSNPQPSSPHLLQMASWARQVLEQAGL